MKAKNSLMLLSGYVGLAAALLLSFGEFLLHYDALGRYGGGYESYAFMVEISQDSVSYGHFISVIFAPLYIIGFWHLMKMLEPASKTWSQIAFFILSYAMIIGMIWIGSRANISAIVNQDTINTTLLISQYQLRYETLLWITRLGVLIFSVIFIYLVLTGRSSYPKWAVLFNPILLILGFFLIWKIIPSIGIYLMPIALNLAFSMLFLISIYVNYMNSRYTTKGFHNV